MAVDGQPGRVGLSRVCQDAQFGAALMAALFFLASLWVVSGREARAFDGLWIIDHGRLFLFQVVAYPVVEELAFRGFMQENLLTIPLLRRHIARFTAANIVTSIIFSGLHATMRGSSSAWLVFFPSTIFGFFRDKYNSVRPSIVLHMLFNGGYFWLFGGPSVPQ